MTDRNCRDLVLVLGDQLDEHNAAVAGAQPAQDVVLMAETAGEAAAVPSHKHRIAVFFAAMRHYAAGLRESGWRVCYRDIDEGVASLSAAIQEAAARYRPRRLVAVEPGEWRVRHAVDSVCGSLELPVTWLDDRHFLCSREEFAEWADGRKRLVMEYFYRQMRRRHGVLMDGDEPVGGEWNYDAENRDSFGRSGPPELPARTGFEPDAVTRDVLDAVERHFPGHPGSTENFRWPVTRRQAREALAAFVADRLPQFGRYQDAMWQDEPFLFHSLLSSSLNLKLLDPREAIDAAVDAWRQGRAPLNAVEGFVRQILGWREFIRGVYWLEMPGYRSLNHFDHEQPLPDFFWTGETEMNCLAQSIGDTLDNGYAHHIQRLMVIGNFALLAGLRPSEVCDWYLAVYVDAVEWVELPNTLGMALHGDGGIVGSKPYAAGGAYIRRMSNYCSGCRYDPGKRTGEDACPYTLLYWDFLARNRERLRQTGRMNMILRNLDRWSAEELDAIRGQAREFRRSLPAGSA